MYEAPDSARAAILISIARQFQNENVDSCLIYAQRAVEKAYSSRQYLALVDAEKLRFQIAMERRNFTDATRHQRTILEITLRERYWDLAMESFNFIAETWLSRNNYAEAIEFLKKGLEIAIDRNNLEYQKNFYQALIVSYRGLRNLDAVNMYYTLLIDVNRMIDAEVYNSLSAVIQTERDALDSAIIEAKNRWQQRSTVSKFFYIFAIVWAIAATTVLVMAYIWYEFKVKTDTIKTKNELSLKTYELEMLIRNQEYAFLFLTKHVHNKISSFAQNINRFEAELGDRPMVANSPINRILNSIQSLYGFFQNFTLLLQAQSGQLKPQIVTVSIPKMVNSLFVEYKNVAAAKGIKLENEVQNNALVFADERLVETVLRNTISNAFKYAPAGTGSVTVGAKVGTRREAGDGIAEDTGYVEVWILDDGVGLTSEQAEILFDLTDNHHISSDPETKGYGLGLAVCKAVIEALKGHIWAETKQGEGLCIRFSLPKARDTEVKTLSLAENNQETISIEEPSETQLLLSE